MRAILAVLCSCLVSCATVSRGRYQTVGVRTDPAGAVVDYDCGSVGESVLSPARIRVLRKADPCVIRIQKEGYESLEIVLARNPGGLVWGNAALGGLATFGLLIVLAPVLVFTGGSIGPVPFALVTGGGIGIDYASGAAYHHVQGEIEITLVEKADEP